MPPKRDPQPEELDLVAMLRDMQLRAEERAAEAEERAAEAEERAVAR